MVCSFYLPIFPVSAPTGPLLISWEGPSVKGDNSIDGWLSLSMGKLAQSATEYLKGLTPIQLSLININYKVERRSIFLLVLLFLLLLLWPAQGNRLETFNQYKKFLELKN